jgi:hypothetical protein
VNFKIFDTFDNNVVLQEQWNNIYNEGNYTPFSSYDWSHNWWLNIGKPKLFVILYYKQNIQESVALFPFMIDSKGVLRFIADNHCDYCEFITSPNVELDLSSLSKITFGLINNEPSISSMELNNLVISNPFIGHLYNQGGFRQFTHVSNASSSIVINKNTSLFSCFEGKRKKLRSELKRVYKKHTGASSKIYTHKDAFPKDVIHDLFNDMVARGERNASYLNKEFLATIEKLYDKNHLIIHELRIEDNPISLNFCMKSKNHYVLWLDLYKDVQYINIASYLKFMEYINKNENFSSFKIDFGRGLYNYKIKNFKPDIIPQLTYFYSKTSKKFFFYLTSFYLKHAVKEFYKKHSSLINKLLRR